MDGYLSHISKGLKPDPYIMMSQWAEESFILPQESASEYGKIRIERTPFIKEVLDALSPMSPVGEVVVVKPTQLAGTTIAIIFIFCVIDLYPAPGIFITVKEDLAKKFSRKRISPSIKLMPSIKSKVIETDTKVKGSSLLMKEFPGGSWILGGSNASSSYRSETAKYMILDDYSAFPPDVEGEGDSGSLADRRTGSWSNSKIYKNSTPLTVGTCLITIAYELTSQGLFCVPCPHCGEYQYLEWGDTDSEHGIKWTRKKDVKESDDESYEKLEEDDIVDIWYQCKACHERIDEHQKPWMFTRGKYIHKYPNRKKKGFKWNALYSPLGWKNNWTKIAEDFIEATYELKQGKPSKMKTWQNTLMAEAWEEKGKRPEWASLYERREDYPDNEPPDGAWLLTAGVDVQENRLIVLVKGWGIGEENWKIFHTEIHGDPIQSDVWNKLDIILNASYISASGHELKVMSVCVDSGYLTNIVYNYCRSRQPRIHAIKGAKAVGTPVIGTTPSKQDVTFNGEKIEDGALLWSVGGDSAKDIIYSRLALVGEGAGVYHWNMSTDEEFFKQLTAEKKQKKTVKGYDVDEWHKMRANDVLDVDIYAYAAALKIGMAHPGFFEALEDFIKGTTPTSGQDPNQGRRDNKREGGNDWLGGGGNLMNGRNGKWL